MRQLEAGPEGGSSVTDMQDDPNINAVAAFNVLDAVMADPRPKDQSF